jgi:hypothetical protein
LMLSFFLSSGWFRIKSSDIQIHKFFDKFLDISFFGDML